MSDKPQCHYHTGADAQSRCAAEATHELISSLTAGLVMAYYCTGHAAARLRELPHGFEAVPLIEAR